MEDGSDGEILLRMKRILGGRGIEIKRRRILEIVVTVWVLTYVNVFF
jgi:hypothetical protein